MTGLSCLLPAPILQAGAQDRFLRKIDSQLVVEWGKWRIQSNPLVYTFEKDVKATYGPTVIHCDKLTVYLDPTAKHGVAEGHVFVTDPDGTISGSSLSFNWLSHTGSGRDVVVHSHGLMVKAKAIDIGAKTWTMEDIYATPCDGEGKPIFEVLAPRAEMSPGLQATIYRPRVSIFGRHVFTLRQYTVAPTRRSTGQPLPSFSYSKASGFGTTWVPGLLIDDETALNAGFHTAQHDKPSRDILLSRSLLPIGQAPGGFVPRSDLDERFSFGYFENVYVKTPQLEQTFLSNRRLSLSAGYVFNEQPAARLDSTALSKPLELILEDVQSVGGFGLYGQVRAQRIQEIDGPAQNRVVGFGSVLLPPVTIRPGLYTDIRFDGAEFANKGSTFGWAHSQLGLVARPSRWIRLGAGLMNATQWGEPAFDADRLYNMHSLSLRTDLLLGPTKFGLLSKYDLRGHKWFDHEIYLSQAIRCLEPYVIFREFPRGFNFGFRLRLDSLTEAIKRRTGPPGRGNPDDLK